MILLAVFFPILTLAAPADPSRMPENLPLLTPNQNGAPNYSGSVNSNLDGGPSLGNNGQEGGQEGGQAGLKSGQETQAESAGPDFSLASPRTGAVVLALILAVLLGYGLWRKGYFKKSPLE